jgi:hypothetical protein
MLLWFFRPVTHLAEWMFRISDHIIDLIEWFCHSFSRFGVERQQSLKSANLIG